MVIYGIFLIHCAAGLACRVFSPVSFKKHFEWMPVCRGVYIHSAADHERPTSDADADVGRAPAVWP